MPVMAQAKWAASSPRPTSLDLRRTLRGPSAPRTPGRLARGLLGQPRFVIAEEQLEEVMVKRRGR